MKAPGAFARRWVSSAQRLVPAAARGTSILGYHLVGAGTQSPVDLDIHAYRDQMAALAEARYEVTGLSELFEKPRTNCFRVVLTFDDAFANFAEVVLPILEDFGFPATLYVPVGFVDGAYPSPLRGANLPALSWTVLRALADHPLIEIGSHSYTHVDQRRLSGTERREDLRRSRATLEDRLGVAVPDYCYPQAKWSIETEADIRRIYRSAVVAGGRINVHPKLHRLFRKPIRRDSVVPFASFVQARFLVEEIGSDLVRRFLR